MSFKAKKLNIDLTLDLTEYIPEDKGGILTTDKIDGDTIFEWSKFAIGEGERLQEMQSKLKKEEDGISMVELTEASRKSIVSQIDFFYNKGTEFYKPLLLQTLNDILSYINEQVSPVKKKSQSSKK